MMMNQISQRLFSDTPDDTLYHYTSLAGLLGIVGSGILRASDVRYMNDSAELKHTLDLLHSHISQRIAAGTDKPKLLNQLLDWLSHRILSHSMLFCGSFRANGNLLSQWRGYSTHGKGVSVGFNPWHIRDCAERQHFQVGKCLYQPELQQQLIENIVDTIEGMADKAQPPESNRAAEEQQYSSIFESIEGDLLRIAAVLKHPSFEEEQEWRIISQLIANRQHESVKCREGTSMLVPYFEFCLNNRDSELIELEHIYLGPTNNKDLSMNSLAIYLEQQQALPKQGIDYCQIPYRQR